jgi:FKBP-type peptidyl-prolyl cis-trans isomerase 2
MVINTGEFILVNYSTKIKDTNELIETTLEEVAKEAEKFDPSHKYEPQLICVGEGWVLKGVEESLISSSVGDKKIIEVSPEKGFGIRDPNKVKMVPARKFGNKLGDLRIGEPIEFENKVGIIRFIGSGRVQIDFNHRLAGKTLVYDFEIVKKLEDDIEKISYLIRRRISIDPEKLSLVIEEDSVKIQFPPEYYLMEGLQIIKRALASDMKLISKINKIYFIELYEIPRFKDKSNKESEKIKEN